jgi:hypothetical protein
MRNTSAFQPKLTTVLRVNPYVDGGDASIYSSNTSSWNTAVTATTGTLRNQRVQATLSGSTRFIERGFFTFDTSAIPDSATVISATFYLYGNASETSQANSPSYRIYTSNHTDTIVAGDYDTMTTTEASNTYVTTPTTGGYNSFPLNASGISAINKTGYTKLAIREANYDVANTQPGGANVFQFYDLSQGLSTAPYLEVVLDTSIPGSTKAYYPLNGNSNDYSGNTNTGTDTAITYPQGRFGQAAKFNNSSSNITFTTVPATGANPFTASLWFRSNTAGALESMLHWGTAASNQAVDFYISATNKLTANLYGGGGLIASTPSVNDDKWHHGLCTCSGTALTLYLDGRLVGTGGAITPNIGTTYKNIGKDGGGGNFFGGWMDEIILENRVWTAKEVETYYRKSMLNYRKGFWARFLQSINITDTLSLSETSTYLRSRISNITDNLNLTENISVLKVMFLTIVDTLHLDDLVTGIRNRITNITDSLGLTDSVRARKKWENESKNPTSFTNNTKSSTSWENVDKN